jgi:hypothetical protein
VKGWKKLAAGVHVTVVLPVAPNLAAIFVGKFLLCSEKQYLEDGGFKHIWQI